MNQMITNIMLVFKAMELELPTLEEGEECAHHRLDLCMDILNYDTQRHDEVLSQHF